MGKALLVLVLGASAILATQLFNTHDGERRADKQQAEFQAEVIAREIAASAFNVGMGEMRAYGEDILDAAAALNGTGNEGRSGTYASGRFAGGSFTVRAEPTSGHSARVVATGSFGGAEFTMHDEYRVFALTSRKGGLLDVSYIESKAGYCSAVFYQAYTMGMAPGTVPPMIMLFGPDNRERATARTAQLLYVEPGTQMNFFIGVDKDCSLRGLVSSSLSPEQLECTSRQNARTYSFQATHFDHLHYALDVQAGELEEASESIWGFVEQKPGSRNIWRIGWEDIHNESWDNPDSDDPTSSLQATKMLGYDGSGWDRDDATGYRVLDDYSRQPDFSDQVIEVRVIAPNDPTYDQRIASYHAQQDNCGEDRDEFPTAQELIDAGTGTDPYTDPVTGETVDLLETPDDGVDVPSDSEDLNEAACGCRQGNKYPIIHRPPGNEANEKLHCLPAPAVVAHLREHNDTQLQCETAKVKEKKNK